MTLIGLPQNLAHDASTVTPKSLILRARMDKQPFSLQLDR